MQSKEYFKIKARKIAKQTWAGPGKFGVFIVICIIIIATFESLGLSNREKNLELRSVPLVAVQLNLKSIEEGVKVDSQDSKLRYRGIKDLENSNKLRDDMLLYGAVDQYLYENSTLSTGGRDDNDKVHDLYLSSISNPEKLSTKYGKAVRLLLEREISRSHAGLSDSIYSVLEEEEKDNNETDDLAFFDI